MKCDHKDDSKYIYCCIKCNMTFCYKCMNTHNKKTGHYEHMESILKGLLK